MIGKTFSQFSSVAHDIDATYINQMSVYNQKISLTHELVAYRQLQKLTALSRRLDLTLRGIDGLPSFEVSTRQGYCHRP